MVGLKSSWDQWSQAETNTESQAEPREEKRREAKRREEKRGEGERVFEEREGDKMNLSEAPSVSLSAQIMKVSLTSLLLFCRFRVFFCTTVRYSTFEEDTPGTEIGNLSKDLKLDPGEDPETSFRFMQKNSSSVMEMRTKDGLMTVSKSMDREQLCLRESPCLLTFDVVVFSKEKFQLVHVEVEVKDINDHSPHFPRNETHLEVLESTAVGMRILLDAAVDQDVGDNYIQSYHMSHSSHFAIDTRLRDDGVGYAELVLVKNLDRELEDSYILEITATDGGTPPRSGSMTVVIKVLDSNDNSPTFEHSSMKVELSEDSLIGVRVLKVHAFDPDEGPNGEVVYRFSGGSSSEMKVFHIDPSSGEVTLRERVDYEKRRSYELQIEAQDLGENQASSSCRVLVDIVDVNDNAPEISIKPMTSSSDGVAYITEAAAQESFVALIRTTDLDSGHNGYVQTRLEGHRHFRLQQAYGDTFMIVTTEALDREQDAEYNLTIIAEDLGSPPFKTSQKYTIRISDENDNPPQFSRTIYDLSVLENNIPGSYVGTVTAHDLDSGKNGKVLYSLIDKQTADGSLLSTFVSLDPLSGSLYSLRSFDFESLKDLEFSVQARDKGSPSLSSTASVRIRVEDENDNFPFFTSPKFKNDSTDLPLPLSAPLGFVALRVEAEDEDDGVNGEISFQILEDDRKVFSIDRKSGAIVLKQRLTMDYGDVLQIRVSVSDNGEPPLSHSATVRFLVTDTALPEDQALELDSAGEERVDVWTLGLVSLVGGCVLLLLVFVLITALCKQHQRKSQESQRRDVHSLYGSTPFSISSTTSAGTYGGTRVFLNNERDVPRECLYEDKSLSSEEKLFLPCKPFHQTNLWQDEKFCLQKSSPTDQLSMKDSGKGDSDFNDSDSDSSADALRRNLTTFQPWIKGSFVSMGPLGVDTRGRYGAPSLGDVYTLGFSPNNANHTNAQPWRESCYEAAALQTRNQASVYRNQENTSRNSQQLEAAPDGEELDHLLRKETLEKHEMEWEQLHMSLNSPGPKQRVGQSCIKTPSSDLALELWTETKPQGLGCGIDDCTEAMQGDRFQMNYERQLH
ncbi:protocadherin-8 [Hoplias malabaricus]|uniref:protocadherin-8 n=1 Tax=Hoplias malabaricus TaxID=27720 RepID=UPI003462B0C2